MTDITPVTPAQPVVVTLPAEIDMANAHVIGEELAAACAGGAVVVIADMTATTFCDSIGFRMLVRAWRWAGVNGTDLRVLVTSPNILRVMKILALDTLLPVYQSLEQALAAPQLGVMIRKSWGPASPPG